MCINVGQRRLMHGCAHHHPSSLRGFIRPPAWSTPLQFILGTVRGVCVYLQTYLHLFASFIYDKNKQDSIAYWPSKRVNASCYSTSSHWSQRMQHIRSFKGLRLVIASSLCQKRFLCVQFVWMQCGTRPEMQFQVQWRYLMPYRLWPPTVCPHWYLLVAQSVVHLAGNRLVPGSDHGRGCFCTCFNRVEFVSNPRMRQFWVSYRNTRISTLC